MEENPIDARIGSSSLQRTDGPGFSLCAAPLESSGPRFQSGSRRSDEQVEVRRYTRPEMVERIGSEGRCVILMVWNS